MTDDPNVDPPARVCFNLDYDRPDLKPVIDQLNPILQQIVQAPRSNPDAGTMRG